ncbi:Mitochondrial distribution and morphology protein 12 [Exophiala dermatitidis]
MSVDIGWDTITSGPEGAALAEKIRAFVDEKFQQVALPRFISAVHVHSFDFGSACPEIEIKDICDPLPDFYDDEEEEVEEEDEEEEKDVDKSDTHGPTATSVGHPITTSYDGPTIDAVVSSRPHIRPHLANILVGRDPIELRHHAAARDLVGGSADPSATPFPRCTTPGIPGGTSNLSYFHFPATGLSGTQTPLAAVASGTQFSPRPWADDTASTPFPAQETQRASPANKSTGRDLTVQDDPSTRPSTANSISSPRESVSGFSSPRLQHSAHDEDKDESAVEDDRSRSLSPSKLQGRQPTDLQVVARVKYSGDVRMTLTAEILLDYPMPSFVGIPVKLAITGMSFDGVAVVAWVQRKMHFCFLDAEDATALVGESLGTDQHDPKSGKEGPRSSFSGPLREIQVESEIGRQEDGKQVLKNVGKVEKFVLEQVRKIFEEEFVFPSYWTFLV